MTLVLGLGNPLLGDDGLGPRAVEALREEPLPAGVRLRDGGTGGLSLLAEIEEVERLLVIDAVDLGPGSEPGALVRLERDELPRTCARGLTAHQVGLRDLLALCALRGTLPGSVVLFGVQVEQLALGTGLSPRVAAALPSLVAAVRGELRRER